MDLPHPHHLIKQILNTYYILESIPPFPVKQNSNWTTLNLIKSYLSHQNSLPHYDFVVISHYLFNWKWNSTGTILSSNTDSNDSSLEKCQKMKWDLSVHDLFFFFCQNSIYDDSSN